MLFQDFYRDLTIFAKPDAPVTPRVSVILPTYARGHGPLQQAIESVLSQDWGDLELLVIDDGSRDATRDVLDAIQRADSRVVVHRYESNSGLPAVRVNQAALRAKGELIAYQFDDDLWLGADSLSMRVRALDQSESPAVVYGNALVHVEQADGTIIERRLGGPFNYGKLRGANYIANNTIVHHARMFDIAGMYDPHVALRRYCDFDLWLRFAKYGDFFWVDADLSQVHANLANSLGKEVPLDLDRYLHWISTDRDALLMPNRIHNYDVLRMNVGVGLIADEARQYFQDEAVPFVTQFNDYCSLNILQTIGSAESRGTSLYVVKPDYSTSIDVTIGNFSRIASFGTLSYRFASEALLPHLRPSRHDSVILYRTVAQATSMWMETHPSRGPLAYLMDDNMLCFHEVGPEHAMLAPGTPAYQGIERQIRSADACIGYGPLIGDDLRELNSRAIQLSTNILSRYILRTEFDRGIKLRIAVLTGPVRHGILAELWPVIQAFALRHANEVEFHFWGADPDAFGGLAADVYHRPFTHHYEQYLERLSKHTFDVMLVPLDDRTRAARSKSPIKFLEGVAAGAVCIFTNALPYQGIPEDCCLKVPNTAQGWTDALERVIALGPEGRARMFERARSLVTKRYTTEAQFYDFMAAMRSLELHRRLGDRAILYCFHETALGGATLHLIQHARLMAALGFRVVALAPAEPQWECDFAARWSTSTGAAALCYSRWPSGYGSNATQRNPDQLMQESARALAATLSAHRVGMLHFGTWSPVMSLLSAFLAVPSVASVHQHYPGSEASTPGFADAIHCSSRWHGREWGRMAQSRVMAQVCPVEERYFDLGHDRAATGKAGRGPWRILVSGTLQQRKNQLEAVGAVVQLRSEGWDVELDLIGYENFYPDYVRQCRALAAEANMADFIHFHGFIDDPLPFYAHADVLLVAATDESMPQTILQAMAAGVAVVSTRVGGVPEMVRHRYTGVLAKSPQRHDLADSLRMMFQLSPLARQELLARSRRAISVVGRTSYVKLKLTDLYIDAAEMFERRFISRESESKKWGPQTLGRLRHAVMEEAVTDLDPPRQQVPVEDALRAASVAERGKQLPPEAFALHLCQLSERVLGVSPRWPRRLQLSQNLRHVPYVEYRLPAQRRPLSRVTLAIHWPDGAPSGMVGIEVVTPTLGVIAQEVVWAGLLKDANVLSVAFREPLPPILDTWNLRVFARDVVGSLTVVERSRRSWLPWRRVQHPVFRVE